MYSKQCHDCIRLILRVLAVLLVFIFVPSPPTSYAAFPGMNGKIAFTSGRNGAQEIYVMNADGSGQTNCTNNPAYDFNPAWSPDGTKIAFGSNRDGNSEIYVVNADCTTGLLRLTNNSADDNAPTWSPDGTKIGFVSNRDGNLEIYIMNADGSGQTNCTNNPATEDGLDWSPDGTQIAFNSSRGGDGRQIYVMNATCTGTPTKLTNGPGENISPSWSPDGTKIAFTSFRDGNSEIYVMNADGSGQINLTNSPTADASAVWSPDGTKIVWASGRPSDNGYDIYVMNADGSAPAQLTSSSVGDDLEPDWQRLPSILLSTQFFLHGTGPNSNPPALFLDHSGPTVTTAKFKDSVGINFSSGNPWKDIGEWTAAPTFSSGLLTALSPLHGWLGLKNSDDQGTNFDVRVEVWKNHSTLVATGEIFCIQGVTRNPGLAKEVSVPFNPFVPVAFDGVTDVLSVVIFTRIGTDGAGHSCGGHSNAVGLRLYFDAVSRDSRFDGTFVP